MADTAVRYYAVHDREDPAGRARADICRLLGIVRAEMRRRSKGGA